MPEVFKIINQERYNWLLSYTKKIEKKHTGINYGYETEDYTWQIFSKKGTLLIKVGFDVENQYIYYEYLTESSGEFSLKSGKTREQKELLTLIPKLEAINAFER